MLRFTPRRPDDERLLVVNLGRDLVGRSFAEPLLAPPPDRDVGDCAGRAKTRTTAARARRSVVTDDGWRIPGHSAIVLRAGGAQTMTVIANALTTELVRRAARGSRPTRDASRSSWKEWLVTNGLGGYASGTVSGALTRRYHGLLVAALPTPFGRTVMLNYVWERLRWPDGRVGVAARRRRDRRRQGVRLRRGTSSASGSRRACRSGPTTSRACGSRSAC